MDNRIWSNVARTFPAEPIPPPDYEHSLADGIAADDRKSIEPDYNDDVDKEKQWRSRIHFVMFFLILLICGLVAGLVISLLRSRDQRESKKHPMVGAMYSLHITNRQYIPQYRNRSSPEYQEMQSELCTEFNKIYEGSAIGDLYRGCGVASLTEGSIISQTYIVFQDTPRTRDYTVIVQTMSDYIENRTSKHVGQVLLGNLSLTKHMMSIHIKSRVLDDPSYKDLKLDFKQTGNTRNEMVTPEQSTVMPHTDRTTPHNKPNLIGKGMWMNGTSAGPGRSASITCSYTNYWNDGVIQKLRELNAVSTLAQLQAHEPNIDPNLEKRVKVEKSTSSDVNYTRITFNPVKCEDAGNYICEVRGLDGMANVAYGTLDVDGCVH